MSPSEIPLRGDAKDGEFGGVEHLCKFRRQELTVGGFANAARASDEKEQGSRGRGALRACGANCRTGGTGRGLRCCDSCGLVPLRCQNVPPLSPRFRSPGREPSVTHRPRVSDRCA